MLDAQVYKSREPEKRVGQPLSRKRKKKSLANKKIFRTIKIFLTNLFWPLSATFIYQLKYLAIS